jgi:hypothetical protein
MIEYRLTTSKKPTLRLWKIEGKRKTILTEVTKQKAILAEQTILRTTNLTTYMKFRDGRNIYKTDEESAIKLIIALQGINGLRDQKRIIKLLEVTEKMERGEIYWWYSLYLRLGHKSISALRKAYL